MLLFLWNPGVLWNSGYWGQPDAVHTFFAVAAVAALCRERLGPSGGLLAASALSKPLGVTLVPWLAWMSLVRRGGRGLGLFVVGGFVATLLVFAPFIVSGRMGTVLPLVLLSVDLMPVTSANAHNLWWILGPWRNADAMVLGPLTPKVIGQVLFGAAYVGILWKGRARLKEIGGDAEAYRTTVVLGAAAVATSFFYLSTHMHENHLYMATPLLLIVAGRSRLAAVLFAACSVAVFTNGFLHDLDLPYRLPGILGAASGTLDPNLQRPFTWLQLVGSFLDSVLVSFVAIGTYVALWREGRPAAPRRLTPGGRDGL
jgi:Gpi18-like mannosyltransferase